MLDFFWCNKSFYLFFFFSSIARPRAKAVIFLTKLLYLAKLCLSEKRSRIVTMETTSRNLSAAKERGAYMPCFNASR
jgi:hypothetical protein